MNKLLKTVHTLSDLKLILGQKEDIFMTYVIVETDDKNLGILEISTSGHLNIIHDENTQYPIIQAKTLSLNLSTSICVDTCLHTARCLKLYDDDPYQPSCSVYLKEHTYKVPACQGFHIQNINIPIIDNQTINNSQLLQAYNNSIQSINQTRICSCRNKVYNIVVSSRCNSCNIQKDLDRLDGELKVNGSEVNCTICQKKVYITRHNRTSCDHIFHRSCLSRWLEKASTCPICRTVLKEDGY